MFFLSINFNSIVIRPNPFVSYEKIKENKIRNNYLILHDNKKSKKLISRFTKKLTTCNSQFGVHA